MVQPTLQEMSLKETHKPRTHDKPKLRQNKLNTFPNQLKVGDKVLLDAAEPHIVTAKPNEEIPLTVLSIFPFGIVEVSHPKFSTFKVNNTRLKPYFDEIHSRNEQYKLLEPHDHSMKGAKIFPSTGYDKLTRPCLATVAKLTKTTRAWTFIHGRGRREQRQTRPSDTVVCTNMPKVHGYGEIVRRAQIQNSRITRAKIGEHRYTISSSRGKKAVVPASKERKGASSSSGPTAKIRHPFLEFPIRPQEELFQILRARPLEVGRCIDWAALEHVQLADAFRALLTTDPWGLFFEIIVPTYLKLTMELYSMFHLQTVMARFDDSETIQFCLDDLTEEFIEENELHALNRHIHHSPLRCWNTLASGAASYNPSRPKASTLPPSLRYLHAILAHMLTGRRESTGVVNTHDAYFLWCMLHGYVIDLAYFITLASQHQTEWHRKGVIFIGPYVMQLARHFSLFNTAAQSSSLTLMARCPRRYRLAQFTEEEAPKDITDDVPPRQEDLPSQPPPPSCLVYAATSYADISERLTRFEQQCFQRFDNIDATLQQIC
ncbi:hypothetical protein GOBAR_AA01890 [Gossypium barbadense]|uniref:Uncharacterized protein n=1 Tax=Gossypium barbadense TaxID=3634 RepID=A0A2P5YSW4_GOSBA|nr:hypothetical protein GOBAR_AA01890 [Gossypium barbadense]